MIVTRAHVSLGSHPQYRPHDSLAQTPPRKEPMVSRYMPVINPRYVKIVATREGELVAFVLAMPDIAEGIRLAKGRLFPTGIIRIITTSKRTKLLVMLLGAIKDEYRNSGLDALMGMRILEEAQVQGMEIIDSHLILEHNLKMRAEYEKEKDKFTIPEKIVLTDVIFLLDPKDSSSIKKANDVLDILRDGKKDPAQLESDGSFVVRELTNPGGTDLPLREEAAKLKEGELSGVIITGGNIHIIKLRTYSRKKLFEFDAVKRMIENNLRAEATKIRLQEWKTKLKSSADIEISGSKK